MDTQAGMVTLRAGLHRETGSNDSSGLRLVAQGAGPGASPARQARRASAVDQAVPRAADAAEPADLAAAADALVAARGTVALVGGGDDVMSRLLLGKLTRAAGATVAEAAEAADATDALAHWRSHAVAAVMDGPSRQARAPR